MNPTTIRTFTGRSVDLSNPGPDDIDIEDIAHSLSRLCRFNGHTREHYSVAQHSLIVSGYVPEQYALWGLLHDAQEAYVGDVSTPLKRAMRELRGVPQGEYDYCEALFTNIIVCKFNLSPTTIPNDVHRVDQDLCVDEMRQFMVGYEEQPVRVVKRIIAIGATEAKYRFLKRYRELTNT